MGAHLTNTAVDDKEEGLIHCQHVPSVLGMAKKATLFPWCDLLGSSQEKVVNNKDRQQEERLQPEKEQSAAQFLLKSQDMTPTQQHPKSQEQDKLLKGMFRQSGIHPKGTTSRALGKHSIDPHLC